MKQHAADCMWEEIEKEIVATTVLCIDPMCIFTVGLVVTSRCNMTYTILTKHTSGSHETVTVYRASFPSPKPAVQGFSVQEAMD